MRPTDGALLVETPPTVIPVRRGYDAIVAAQQMNPIGPETLKKVEHSRREMIELAEKEFRAIEDQLLDVIEQRKSSTDPRIRREQAVEIGILQDRLATASTALQSAITPRRSVLQKNLMKVNVHYETNSESIIKLWVSYSDKITVKERSIEKSTAEKKV